MNVRRSLVAGRRSVRALRHWLIAALLLALLLAALAPALVMARG